MDPTPAANQAARGERLESWKEIAAYLKRDIRTVQRWEKQEALPVYRHVHDERGTAYAYAGEIDEWLRLRSRREVDATAAGDVTHSELIAGSTRVLARRPSRTTALIAFSIVVAIIVGIWALSRQRPARTPLSSLSLVFGPSERVQDWGPDTALSPDGSTLVYIAGNGSLHIRRIEQFAARVVPDTTGSWGPFFSPDGRWIGFNRQGQLMKVPVDGGTPMPLGATTPFVGGADWGVNDRIVYAAITPGGTHGLYQVAASGGAPQLITALEANADDAYFLTPQWLADGKLILCTLARTVTSGPRFQVIAVSPATGERRVLVDDGRHAMYIGDGVLVFWQNAALFATRFDPVRAQVIGSPVPAWDDVWERVRVRAWTSAAGTLVYWPDARLSHRLVWVDRSGKQEPLPLPPAMYHAPRVSPDGQTVAYAIGHDFSSDVWKHDLATGATVRLTSGGRSAVPLWTPDGQRLIVSRLRASGRDLAELHVRGTSEPKPIALPETFLPGASKLPIGWADSGRTLLVRVLPVENQPVIWAVTPDGTSQPRPVAPSALYADISGDGGWIAYRAQESIQGLSQVFVTTFPHGRPEWKVSTAGGVLPVWANTGRELFYRSGNRIMAVPVTLGETFTSGTPQPLFEAPYYEGDPGSPNYDVTPDGQRFVMVFPADTGGPARLNVVQGWKAEILRRLRDTR